MGPTREKDLNVLPRDKDVFFREERVPCVNLILNHRESSGFQISYFKEHSKEKKKSEIKGQK